ncbi:sulfate transporter, partial [Trifolium medium]|nr:sulfate transporter [Trifolium medium]
MVEDSEPEQLEAHGGQEHRDTVSAFVEKIAEELVHDEGEVKGAPHRTVTDFQAASPLAHSLVQGDNVHDLFSEAAISTIKQPVGAAVSSCQHEPSMGSLSIGGSMKTVSGDSLPTRRKRTLSCPPGGGRSFVSGPWSLEWLHDHNHGDA